MWQQYRWQMIAFSTALVLFAIAFFSRMTTQPVVNNPVATSTLVLTNATAIPEQITLATAETVNTPPLPTLQVQDDMPTFREAIVGRVQRLNPLYADLNTVDANITSLIFEGLIRINEYGEPVPSLAKSWVISSDSLEYVLTLREDIQWQDGIPFNADDVLYTMSLLSDPSFDGLAELGAFWRTVETEKLAPHIVRFRLAQPLASFLTSLTIGLLPEHALRGTTVAELATHPFNLTPIGTGAYQLEALRSPDTSTITAVDLRVSPIFRQRPEGQNSYAIERLSFVLFNTVDDAISALNTGLVDGYASRNRTEREAVLSSDNATVFTTFAPSVGVLIYNWNESENIRFFTELRARVALQKGLNRIAPVEAHLINQAISADSPIMQNSWAYASNLVYPATDSTEALTLLLSANISTSTINAEATQDPDQVAEIYAFSILVVDDPSLVSLANEIAAQWAQLRLAVTVEAVSSEEYNSRIAEGLFQTAIVELSQGADPDPFPYWHVGQSPDGKNWGSMADDRLSELLERARRDPNGLNRIILYRSFQESFLERAVAIPLYYPLFSYAVNTRIQGVQVGFIGATTERFRNIAQWSTN